MDKKEALVSMGYRCVKNDIYAKPIGFQFITVELKPVLLISNWFKDANGVKTMLWDTSEYDGEGTFLDWIKGYESNTRLNVHTGVNTEFHFLTLEQKLEL